MRRFGERAHVEDGAAAGELADEAGVVDGADAVADPVGAEALERGAHGFCAGQLAGVRHRSDATRARDREGALERLGRIFEAADPEADDAAVSVLDRESGDRLRLLRGVHRRDVGRESHLDAVQLPRFARPVAVAGEDLVGVEATPEARREDRLEVDGAVRGGFGRIVDDDLAKVVVSTERPAVSSKTSMKWLKSRNR